MSSLPNLNTASLNAIPNGFWEIGSYKANVQRIHRGSVQLDEISRFIKERMSIENNYAKQLERWNDEWNHFSEKHLPDGSMKSSFTLILDESKELAKVHSSIKERFNDEVLKTIELFKRDNYHRTTFRGFKEAKEMEDEFEKAQKQWKKLFERMETNKRAYHSAARTEKSTYIQYMNTKTNSAQTDGTEAKARERFEKCSREVKQAKTAYEQILKEITAYNGIYMENMAFVFEKCQQMEMKRLRFIMEMLSGMQKILVDLVNPPKLVQLHAKLRQHFLATTDATIGEDLKRWSLLHGVDCATNWPRFEEYSAELRQFSGSKARRVQQKEQQQTDTAVVLTKKVMKDEDESPQNGSRFRSYLGETAEDAGTIASSGSGGGGNLLRNAAKYHSIDSQLSAVSSSKSAWSKSERTFLGGAIKRQNPTKNDGGGAMVLVDNSNLTRQQQNPANAVDPLSVDLFPMVTPQKTDKSGHCCNANGNVSPPDSSHFHEIGDHNGRRKDSVSSAEHSSDSPLRQDGAESVGGQTENEAAAEAGEADSAAVDVPLPLPVGLAKALYDYEPIEGDEIGLVKGELLDIVSGPDHLGWCLGTKRDGSTGLFPAGYVLPLNQSRR